MTKLRTQTLGAICDAVGGTIRTGPFGSQLHESDYREDGAPVVMPKNIVGGRISLEGIARIGHEDEVRLAQHKLSRGDIVYGRRGDIGRRALITEREDGWLCGTGCLRISLGRLVVDPVFLYYFLGQPNVTAWIYNQSIGATLPNLNTDIIRSVSVCYPPLLVQRKIAAILSAYDDLIENNARRIGILEEMARLIYREWFVHFRFPGHGKVRLVDSPLGKIPQGWRAKHLGEVCEIVMGQSPKSEFYNGSGEGLPFHQGVTDFGKHYPTDRVYCTVRIRIAEADDILLSVRAPVGRINVADKRIVIGRGLCAIRNRGDNQLFTLDQLKERFKEEDTMGGGTIFKAVTKRDVQGIDFLDPSEQVVAIFEGVRRPIASAIGVLTRKNANLRRTRDLLLPKLVSGELDVSGLEVATA